MASMKQDLVHIHLVSDATGETLSSVATAALAQFETVKTQTHHWFMVRSQTQLEDIIDSIKEKPGLVFYTLVNTALRSKLEDACADLGLPFVSILDPVLNTLSHYTGEEISQLPGRQHVLDAAYFRRIEAIDFALMHDDGQMADDLYHADVILVGVSRTSKTPTCIYLANRGYKAANIPLVPNLPVPDVLHKLKTPLIVGLINSADRLVQIRRNRIRHLHGDTTDPYADMDAIQAELKEARRLFNQMGWPIIDMSRRSVEETAAAILNLLSQRNTSETLSDEIES